MPPAPLRSRDDGGGGGGEDAPMFVLGLPGDSLSWSSLVKVCRFDQNERVVKSDARMRQPLGKRCSQRVKNELVECVIFVIGMAAVVSKMTILQLSLITTWAQLSAWRMRILRWSVAASQYCLWTTRRNYPLSIRGMKLPWEQLQ